MVVMINGSLRYFYTKIVKNQNSPKSIKIESAFYLFTPRIYIPRHYLADENMLFFGKNMFLAQKLTKWEHFKENLSEWVGHLFNSFDHHVWPVCLFKLGV